MHSLLLSLSFDGQEGDPERDQMRPVGTPARPYYEIRQTSQYHRVLCQDHPAVFVSIGACVQCFVSHVFLARQLPQGGYQDKEPAFGYAGPGV
jgi:hypothetical protein